MANPSDKSPQIADFLEAAFGRTTAIQENRCIPAPVGCGRSVSMEDFEDEASRREYTISGLCMDCQRQLFRTDP